MTFRFALITFWSHKQLLSYKISFVEFQSPKDNAKSDQGGTEMSEDNAESPQDGVKTPKKEETSQEQSQTPKKQDTQPKPAKKKKPTVKTIDLQVEHFVSSLSQVDLNKLIEKEVVFIIYILSFIFYFVICFLWKWRREEMRDTVNVQK